MIFCQIQTIYIVYLKKKILVQIYQVFLRKYEYKILIANLNTKKNVKDHMYEGKYNHSNKSIHPSNEYDLKIFD